LTFPPARATIKLQLSGAVGKTSLASRDFANEKQICGKIGKIFQNPSQILEKTPKNPQKN